MYIHCKLQTGLENNFLSHSLALRIFQPRGPAGLAEGVGLTSSIALWRMIRYFFDFIINLCKLRSNNALGQRETGSQATDK